MSHSLGEIWSKSGRFYGYFEYNGTCDTTRTRIHFNKQGVHDNWRADNWRDCTCGTKEAGGGEVVVLYTSYGFGSYQPGRVCWECMAIIDGIQWDGDDEVEKDGHPFFEAWMIKEFGKPMPCPGCGRFELRSDGEDGPIRCGHCNGDWYEWQLGKFLPAPSKAGQAEITIEPDVQQATPRPAVDPDQPLSVTPEPEK
jgi:hypothetical protein